LKNPGKANKKEVISEKSSLHPRNKHRSRYDFKQLIEACPELASYVLINPYGVETIDFSNADAVKVLNKSLLKQFYGIEHWDIPANYLCPPIPGRADYIHYLADLLAESNNGNIPKGKSIKGLDVGIGANCIYPILGNSEYGWSFVGSDIDRGAIKSARNIVTSNSSLSKAIDCRLQNSSSQIYKGIIKPGEQFDFSICNPPFHGSREEAKAGSLRKTKNLGTQRGPDPVLNFAGKSAELWCEGGEVAFIRRMIEESVLFAENCLWFTTLVSKKENLKPFYSSLSYHKASDVRTIQMAQGQKVSRMLAWTFLDAEKRSGWGNARWVKR